MVTIAGNARKSHVLSQEAGPSTALHVHVGLALFERLSLVVQLPAPTERELELDEMALQVETKGHNGHALLDKSSLELEDLALLKQKTALAHGIVVETVCLHVRRHMALHEPRAVSTETHECLGQVGFASSDALHLTPDECDAGLEAIEELVLVSSSPVHDEVLHPVLLLHGASVEGLVTAGLVEGRTVVESGMTGLVK